MFRLLHPRSAAAVLAGLLIALPAPADQAQDIQKLEQQIAELQKELAARKKTAETSPASAAAPAGTIPLDASRKMQWRNVGPANMGGRITALAVYEPDPAVYYVATASGGLLKTVNNGTTFEHQFDTQATVSIGDVAVSQKDPNVVWVGTGEANPRNSVSYGDGVYKSTDGGKTFTNMGLKASFQIGKILLHPTDPNTVYVGALGRLYGPNEERGLFKTTDGGKTWAKALYVDANTGVIDARLDPSDPNTLIVAMWERKRDEFDGYFPGQQPVPDQYGPVVTHGKGGGLFKSTDAGKTWKKLTDEKLKNGLPTVKTGRIGLDYSRKTKGLVYAIIDTEKVGTGDAPKQVYLGVQGEDVPDSGGAKIVEVTAAAPAAKAGLKADDIVNAVDGTKIESYDQLVERIRAKKAGDKLKLSVKRGSESITVEVTLENRPGATTTAGTGGGGGGGTRGQRAAQQGAANRPTAGFFPAPAADVLKIQSLLPDGPSAKAGIKEGDEITAVDGKAIKGLAEYRAAVEGKQIGDKIKLTVKRGEETKVYEVTLAAPQPSPTQPQVTGAPTAGRLMPGFAPEFNFQATELKVGTVTKDSAAEKAGIKVGDLILEIDGKKIAGVRDFIQALRTGQNEDNPRKAGDKVKVKVKQGEKTIEAELALAMMDIPGAGGGRQADPNKPYLMGLGGQIPNAQEQQGKDGYQTGGVYKSTDNGDTWTRVNSLNSRPMYFSVVRVDPTDDNVIYSLCDTPTPIYKSTDGGKTFSTLRTASGVHADAHALWINPANKKHLVIGCDGGFYTTYDQGATWDHLNNFALGQFYHVAVDNKRPYRIYGGLQDNGSWGGPSNSLRSYGPINEDWLYVSGGDGFVCRVDPTDPDLVYTESQGGNINRRNFRTGERGFIRPRQPTGEPAPRFNWNTPFILSAHNPSIFYTASQYVWRSIKKGTDLRKVSPEITRTKGGSGTALSESPLNPDVVWAGTDDGHVWVTKDGGATWTNVTPNVQKAGVSGYRHVATLEASRDKEGRCYLCLDAHRSDDDKPYLFVTEDHGTTWKPIAANLPAVGSTRCLREDITNADILYCGTEFGAFVSGNRGASWTKLGGNLPTVAVHEFAQPTVAGELVAGTHGRSVWIVDITSLRQMTPKALDAKAALFAPGTVTRWRNPDGSESPYSRTDRRFVGQNPYRGAYLDYHLKDAAKAVSLKVVDAAGKTVRTFDKPAATAGFQRVTWNLSRSGGGEGGRGGRGGQGGGQNFGAPVSPGVYRVVLTVDGEEFSQPLTVELDPNAPKDLISLEEELPKLGEEDDQDELDREVNELKRLLQLDD